MHPYKTPPFAAFRAPLSFTSVDPTPRMNYFDATPMDDAIEDRESDTEDGKANAPRKRAGFGFDVEESPTVCPTTTRRSLLVSLTAAAVVDSPSGAALAPTTGRPRLRSTGSLLAASTAALTLDGFSMSDVAMDLSPEEWDEGGLLANGVGLVKQARPLPPVTKPVSAPGPFGRSASWNLTRKRASEEARCSQSTTKPLNRKPPAIPASATPNSTNTISALTPADLDLLASLATPPRARSMHSLDPTPNPNPSLLSLPFAKRPGRHSATRSLSSRELLMSSSPPSSSSEEVMRSPSARRFRRTYSMVEGPKEFVGEDLDLEMEEGADKAVEKEEREEEKQEEEEGGSVEAMKWHEGVEGTMLPCFEEKGQDVLKRISPETLISLLDGTHQTRYDEHCLIDCRFPYEYEGGHIQGAVSVNTQDAIERMLLTSPRRGVRMVLVFHCEFSAHRAPRMALHLRNRDRQLNMARYPYLHYPEVYILKGGYSAFFQKYKERCTPQRYVEMTDSRHRDDLKQRMTHFKKNFGRSKSFTEGFTGWEGREGGRVKVAKVGARSVEEKERGGKASLGVTKVGGGSGVAKAAILGDAKTSMPLGRAGMLARIRGRTSV
ncbi:hypothetical protein BC938DRAFT_480859 [Jimgerdemannia flammicorona]|uniref:M-phase inducer phosphatase n=1 Tax=Jimgerdemannia flammicorona TaxID=994334 RepID=A0A433QHM9_9FUNG|nr:hypothetical protein BC938DRAFT_480859 [Jimgerdemannia flammicorona]